MVKIYACLLGEWVCLSDDPDCTIGNCGQSPNVWWEEGAELWAPFKREHEHSLYQLNYITIRYNSKTYRINPVHIQIVSE